MTTALRDAIDYTTLGWIKPELDETLRQARIEIEAFAENPEAAHMATTAARLHGCRARCAWSNCMRPRASPRRWSSSPRRCAPAASPRATTPAPR
jgi:hypothetical protein